MTDRDPKLTPEVFDAALAAAGVVVPARQKPQILDTARWLDACVKRLAAAKGSSAQDGTGS